MASKRTSNLTSQSIRTSDEDGVSPNVQQLLVCKEEWSSSLDQEQPEPPHIKEEPEDLWTSQEAEQLPGLEEGNIIKFTVSPVPVKSEDEDETRETEPLASTSAGQMETHADGEDCGGSRDPAAGPEPSSEGQVLSSDCSGDEGEDGEEEEEDGQDEDDDDDVSNQKPSLDCKVCRKPFSNKGSLMKHIKVHVRQCGLCGQHLDGSQTLDDHFEVHKKCHICGKRYSFVSGLDRHVRMHTGEKPFRCGICGKRVTQKHGLQKHMKIHAGRRDFLCNVCGKDFLNERNLKEHMRIHTGEKPYACGVCGKDFTHKLSLKIHSTLHTGQSPYTCTFCRKGFIMQSRLAQHMRVHTGERPFKCSLCGKDFIHKVSLKTHMKSHASRADGHQISGSLKTHLRTNPDE